MLAGAYECAQKQSKGPAKGKKALSGQKKRQNFARLLVKFPHFKKITVLPYLVGSYSKLRHKAN